jgi:nucleoside-diphosphate-sugar epimerase
MIKVAVFGAKGFVGKKLCLALSAKKYNVVPVTRDNYSEFIGKKYDVVINSAMPSARFWAKNNPEKDFKETVQKTADIFYGCQFDKFIQISTVSARCQLDTIYGRHKLAAENLCNFGENLVVRLSSIFGDELKKGVLIDMLKGQKVFLDGESRYSFTNVDFIAEYIASHLELSGVVEVGAYNTLRMVDIAKYLNKNIEFEGSLDIQEIKDPAPGFPDAKEVYSFLDKIKN